MSATGAQTITVGASPYTWTNTMPGVARVYVSGGTGIQVTFVDNGGTLTPSVARVSDNNTYYVPSGASLVVAYTTVPTMTYQGSLS